MGGLIDVLDEADDNQQLGVRRRVLRIVAAIFVVQGILALVISIRAKRAERERASKRPERYPHRSFDPIRLDDCGTDVQLYMRGPDLLADQIAAIDEAKDEVLFETFIYVDDVSGRAMRDALARARERDVRVYVLWDWLLSDKSVTEEYFAPGTFAYPFRRITPTNALRPDNILRDHRKVLVVDQQVAFVGGYNIGDEYLQWRDTHLRLRGPAAREFANAFCDFWNDHVPSMAPRLPNVAGRTWDPHVLVHRNDPSLAIFPIRGMYIEAIDRAASRVWITNAYFVPDRSFRRALATAARRGVDVRVMLPARSNHPLTDTLAHGIFSDLLGAGVRVFLYRDFMVHAKTAVIDDAWVTVGTANLDRWSMLGNYEINVEVRSPRLARQVAEMYEFDIDNCDELHLEGWDRRPLAWKASERLLATFAPLM